MGGISRTVVALGVVSLLTDMSSEMIFPLLPVFLSTVLLTGASSLGVIEGFAETTSSLFKLISGSISDRLRKRKILILGGYGLSGLVRPLIGLAVIWPFILGIRILDRLGKGLRSSPRDALIADVTEKKIRGRAFGFHRSMDHAGAVLGPVIAALLLFFGFSLRDVFFFAAIPALFVVIVIVGFVKDAPSGSKDASSSFSTVPSVAGGGLANDRAFLRLLAAIFLFTLGNSSDAFFLLLLNNQGVSPIHISLLWSAHHVVKMVSTYVGGRLSDRLGHRRMILGGWIYYSIIYFAFAATQNVQFLILIFLFYGVYYGLTEPSEKALIADIVHPEFRGRAYGIYQAAVGLGALPASLLFGILWEKFGSAFAFYSGAGFALISVLLLGAHSLQMKRAE